jgi:hypothetical protein
VLICACGFLAWADLSRIRQVQYVNGLAGEPPAAGEGSSTGYAKGQRQLIVPERNESSFEWIAQTQQMFAQNEWRIRRVDYDNAPGGRRVSGASPYRWLLGTMAWCNHAISGRPVGAAVEDAALWLEPGLHGVLLIGGTLFVAWRFGGFAAALVSIGLVMTFPFAVGFLPGVPDSHGLARILGLGGILLVLTGMHGAGGKRWFALGGIAAGLGVWIDVPTQEPLLLGILLGGAMAEWIMRRSATRESAGAVRACHWRFWSLGASATVLLAYFVECFPDDLGSWRLDSIHPLWGLACLGTGELLAGFSSEKIEKKEHIRWPRCFFLLLTAVAIAAVPMVVHWSGGRGFFAKDYFSVRLTNLPGGSAYANLRDWFKHDGMNARMWVTFSPLLVAIAAGWLVATRKQSPEFRASMAFVFGPVLVALVFAFQQLSWWSVVDGLLLILLVAIVAARSPVGAGRNHWGWVAMVGLFALPGMLLVAPQRSIGPDMILTTAEAGQLVERDLAHWLAKHTEAKSAVVFAPPRESQTLSYFGGLRAVGTFAPDNSAGFGTTLMITGARTMEEVQGLLQAREVRFIVVPSWDPFFDEFARLYLAGNFSHRKSFLVEELRRLNPPPWLKPLTYSMPVIGGFEKQSVLVFEVVEEQSPALANSRLAEFLVEMGNLAQATAVGETLRRFPGDVGALSARAQVLNAREDAAGFAQTVDTIVARLANGADRFLAWDRRVSVAVTLAEGHRLDLAREQTQRCLADLTGKRLRTLSSGALFRLLVLSEEFKIPIADPGLRGVALDLLPRELRGRL